MPQAEEVARALDARYRAGHGRLLAALTRRFGVEQFASVENAAQEAYTRALAQWPSQGIPDDPERWLVRVAHNVMIDAIRRDRPTAPLLDVHQPSLDPPSVESDDELRLVFLCCDPVLTRAAQLALVLNVAFGLGARQIATSFVSDERTVAQRIVRAKQRLREAGVRFDLPEDTALPARLDVILDVLYLVFTEGFHPSENAVSLDDGLCREALRLARLLTDIPRTARPSAFALRALLCLHASRIPARVADDGSLLLLPEQDRTRWDTALIAEAFSCLEAAAAGEELTRFHIEAAIAACHAIAPTYASTDWTRLVDLYDLLRARAPSLVVDVNRALAIAMRSGAAAGLDELDAIPEREVLSRYPYALAAYADLHASLGNLAEARDYLDRALANQSSPAQRALLSRKRLALETQ